MYMYLCMYIMHSFIMTFCVDSTVQWEIFVDTNFSEFFKISVRVNFFQSLRSQKICVLQKLAAIQYMMKINSFFL